MKRKFSLSAALHNDRLMLIVSVILAVAVWAVVAYGPANEQERTISGVPVVLSLGEYATDTLNLRIVDGQDIKANVTVYGRRSVVEQLTAQDILLTADTSTVITPGSYSNLYVKATKNGKTNDYEILTVDPGVASLTCDIWVEEKAFVIQTQMPNLTSADEAKYQIGTPVVEGDKVENSIIKISGPKKEIDSIVSVVAIIEDKAALSATRVFNDVTLKAVDADGKEVNISHCTLNADNAKVNVTVPILSYKRIDLNYTLLNVPGAYMDAKNLVTFSPSYIEVWGPAQTIEDYEATLKMLCTFDFDHLTKEKLNAVIELGAPETLKVMGGVETVTAKFNLGNITSKKLNLTLTADNVSIQNGAADATVIPTETTLSNITLYGPSNVLRNIREKDLLAVVDLKNETTQGQRTLLTRISLPNHPNVWVYYGETASGYDLMATVGKK